MLTSRNKVARRPFTLSILCGGRSARLGSDKGLFRPLEDESLIVRMIRLLGSEAAEILVIVKDENQKSLYQNELKSKLDQDTQSKTHVLSDSPSLPYASLTGILTALKTAKQEPNIIVAVDHVGVRQRHLAKLLEHYATTETSTCFDVEGFAQPFPALWKKSSFKTIEALAQNKDFAVRGALEAIGTVAIPLEDDRSLSVNANTPEDMFSYFGSPLKDRFDRRLHYVRLSLTESCNMACSYCLPDGFPEWYRHKARLQKQDIQTILQGFRRLGFRKLRLTGGEPTVHPASLDAVKMAAEFGFEEISITTNGLLIKDLREWKDAGLSSINISMDSLDAKNFEAITKSKDHHKVLSLIDDAIALGLQTKVNTVLMRSKNAHEAEALIDWALKKDLTLRFIELMPTGLNQDFSNNERVSGKELETLLTKRGMHALSKSKGIRLTGPSSDYTHPEFPGRIGLINPLSCNFCDACNRLRVSAQGKLRLCLFGKGDLPLDLDSPEALEAQIRALIEQKEERHHLENGDFGNVATFRTIGG